MVWSFLAPKWPILALFCKMDYQNPVFYGYPILFLLEAVVASQCYFFEKWLSYPKISYLSIPEPSLNQIQVTYLYLSEPIHRWHFNMRYPVSVKSKVKISSNFVAFLENTNFNTTHYCRNLKGLFKNYKAFFIVHGSKNVIFLGEGFVYLILMFADLERKKFGRKFENSSHSEAFVYHHEVATAFTQFFYKLFF